MERPWSSTASVLAIPIWDQHRGQHWCLHAFLAFLPFFTRYCPQQAPPYLHVRKLLMRPMNLSFLDVGCNFFTQLNVLCGFVSTAVSLLLHLSAGCIPILCNFAFFRVEEFACREVLFVIGKVYFVDISHSVRTF